MKKVVWVIAGICFLISFILFVTSCTPEQVQKFNDGLQQQLTDPAGTVQQTAATVGQAAGTAQTVMAPIAASIPYGTIILAGLAALQGVCNLIQRMTITKQGTAIKEIVAGGEQFKTIADTNAVELFKQAQTAAQQTAATRLIVSQVKAA